MSSSADMIDRCTRRRLLTATGTAATVFAAGCVSDGSEPEADTDGPPPEPIDLGGGKTDDLGGMIIGEHGGPNGQIFYENESPDGRENPAWFHSLLATLFPYHFEREDRGWKPRILYVTDYSAVDYELTNHGGNVVISSHTDPETFADARELRYVAGSDVLGGMGPDLIPFSENADLEAFRGDHGGEVLEFDEITEERVTAYQ